MRRGDLATVGIQLPVLPAVALGALPGEPDWAPRLVSLGLDVIQSGAAADTPETLAAARSASPHPVVKARPGDAEVLVAAGARLLEADQPVPDGAYALRLDDGIVIGVRGDDPRVEDPNDVAACFIAAARSGAPAELWAASSPGLDRLPVADVEAKLAALVEGARLARLAIAKVQFEDDAFFSQ